MTRTIRLTITIENPDEDDLLGADVATQLKRLLVAQLAASQPVNVHVDEEYDE